MINYRQAVKGDAPRLKEIAKRVISTNYLPFLGVENIATFIESGMSDKEIDDGLNDCTLLTLDGQIIGFTITYGNVLHLMMIDTPFQRAGYGSALLSHIEIAKGMRCVTHALCYNQNLVAQADAV